MEELEELAQVWPALTLAMAGSLIGLDYQGDVHIERGLLRKEDERLLKAVDKEAQSGSGGDGREANAAAIPSVLVTDLTAQKTAAIRISRGSRILLSQQSFTRWR
jgi:hypothetical protein